MWIAGSTDVPQNHRVTDMAQIKPGSDSLSCPSGLVCVGGARVQHFAVILLFQYVVEYTLLAHAFHSAKRVLLLLVLSLSCSVARILTVSCARNYWQSLSLEWEEG